MFKFLIKSILVFATSIVVASCAKPQKVIQAHRPQVIEVSEMDKLQSTFHLIEGVRQRNLNNWPQAIVEFLAATEKDPNNDAAYYELAKAHLLQGEYSDAVTFAQHAHRIDPQNIHYALLLADLYVLSENTNGAIEIFEMLSRQHPGRVEFLIRLANTYNYANQPAKALEVYDRIEKEVGPSEMITVQKLRLLMKLGRTREAIAEAEKMVQMFPDETLFLETLADLYYDTGQKGRALEILQQFYDRDPENVNAIFMLADHYQKTEEWDKVLQLLQKGFENPDVETNEKERILYILYYVVDENPEFLDPTIALARAFVDQNPSYAQAYNIYADLLRQADRNEEARDAYKKSTQLDPSNMVVWQQLLFADMRIKDFEAMVEHSEEATELFFEQPLLFLLHAHAHIMLKNYQEALDALTHGLFILQDDPTLRVEFLIMLGDVNHYLGNHRESNRNYELALTLDPENAGALNNYAYMLSLRKERLQEAKEMARKAVSLSPGTSAFEDTMGWIYFQVGDYNNAKLWIEKAINNAEEPSGTVYEHFGDVLYKLGEKDRALEYWKRADKVGDGSELLLKKIKDRTFYEE